MYRKEITKDAVANAPRKINYRTAINVEDLTEKYRIELTKINAFQKDSKYLNISDDYNGELFAKISRDKLCYVPEDKSWYIYQGGKWEQTESIGLYARAFARAVYTLTTEQYITSNEFIRLDTAEKKNYRKKQDRLLDASFSDRMSKVASDYLVIHKDRFDSQLELINLKNGTYNLKSKKLQKHSPSNYLTKQADVRYLKRAKNDIWEDFLKTITENDKELESFLQKKLGASLSGVIHTEDFCILYGRKTRNGKSTLCNTIANLLGTYAENVQPEVLMKSAKPTSGEDASPEIAKLQGIRYILFGESGQSSGIGVLDTEKIKAWTGNDYITARKLYGQPFTFQMQGHIFSLNNALANVPDPSIFASHRCNVIPFNHHFTEEEADLNIKEYFKLEDVKSAIFNWLLKGYEDYEKAGWNIPKPLAVIEATAEYKEQENAEQQFLNDYLVETDDETAVIPFKILFAKYLLYARNIANKRVPMRQNEYYRWLLDQDLRYKDDHKSGKRIVGYKFSDDIEEIEIRPNRNNFRA